MQIVDTNVLVYAVDAGSSDHETARTWLDRAVQGRESVAFPWIVVVGFLRVATHAALFDRPLSIDAAIETIEGWLAQPAAVVIDPATRHLRTMRELLAQAGTAGNLVNDAHVATLALEHGAEVVSFDRDFARFEGVRWRLPG